MKKVEADILKEYKASPKLSLVQAAQRAGKGGMVGVGYRLPDGLYCRYVMDAAGFIELQGMLARHGALEVFYWKKGG